jgi:shikimate kinase
VAELMEQRRTSYEAAADVTVATDGLAVEQIVCHVQELLKRT